MENAARVMEGSDRDQIACDGWPPRKIGERKIDCTLLNTSHQVELFRTDTNGKERFGHLNQNLHIKACPDQIWPLAGEYEDDKAQELKRR